MKSRVSNITDRIKYIDLARFIGLVLVLFCHIPMPEGIFHDFVYSFHVPLFFLLAGVFLKPNVKSTFISGLKNLIIPYLLINLILVLCGILISIFYEFTLYNDVIYPILGIVCGTSSPEFIYKIPGGPSWFIIALFWSRIIVSLIINLKLKYQIISVIAILCTYFVLNSYFEYTILCIDSALLGCIFMLIGYYLKSFILNISKTNIYIIGFILCLSPLLLLNGTANMFKGEYGNNIILFFINGTIGSLILLYICSKINLINRYITLIVSGAIFFIIFHTFIMEYVMLLYRRLVNYELDMRIYDKIIISIITIIIIYSTLKLLGKRIPYILK